MRFHFSIFLILGVTIVALKSRNLFTSQESSEDLLLPFETSIDSQGSFLDDHNAAAAAADGNLFTDSSNPTDFSTGLDGGLNSIDLLEASCPSKDGQPSKRSRTRRDGVCAPNDQPSIDGLINTLGILGDPSQREEGLQGAAASSAETDTGSICAPPFPYHLCCLSEGDLSSVPSMPIPPMSSGKFFATMQNCHPADILPDCFDYEVCCQSFSYPASSQQINADLALLEKNGNIQALAAYHEWLQQLFKQPSSPTGHNCYRIQMF